MGEKKLKLYASIYIYRILEYWNYNGKQIHDCWRGGVNVDYAGDYV